VFDRESYDGHTKCISEDQKYGGANYVSKEYKVCGLLALLSCLVISCNYLQGEVKQNSWLETVEKAIENVQDPKLKALLKNIRGFENIPRKEKKVGILRSVTGRRIQ